MNELLLWALPSGFLATLFGWWVGRKERRMAFRKEEHLFYKELYDEVHERFKILMAENRKLYRAVARLEKAIAQMAVCDYAYRCPISRELQKSASSDEYASSRNSRGGGGRRDDDQPRHCDSGGDDDRSEDVGELTLGSGISAEEPTRECVGEADGLDLGGQQ